MTVFECLEMLGKHNFYKIVDSSIGCTDPISAYEVSTYSDEFPKDVWDVILEKPALIVDLESKIIFTKES